MQTPCNDINMNFQLNYQVIKQPPCVDKFIYLSQHNNLITNSSVWPLTEYINFEAHVNHRNIDIQGKVAHCQGNIHKNKEGLPLIEHCLKGTLQPCNRGIKPLLQVIKLRSRKVIKFSQDLQTDFVTSVTKKSINLFVLQPCFPNLELQLRITSECGFCPGGQTY